MFRSLRASSLAGIIFLVLSSPISFAQTQTIFFQPPTYPGVGVTATADFNQDGKPDLVTADGTLLLGNGDGTFRTGTALSVANPLLNAIGVADFNHDGKPDVLFASTNTTDLYVFLGNGDGTFRPIPTNIGVFLSNFAVADVNGDGVPDIVGTVGSNGGASTTVWVFLGKGDGTFTVPGTSFSAASIPIGLLLLGDFNGDKKIDVALTGPGTMTTPQPVGIMLGDGHGNFQPPIVSTGVVNAKEMVAGDFNADSNLDLVISSFNTPFETYILLGDGTGHFQAPAVTAMDEGVVTAADFNGDGILDLAIGTSPSVDIFLGNGDGTFVADGTYLYGFYQPAPDISSIVVADFNNDGKLDLAAQGTVLLGKGNGTFSGNAFVQTSMILIESAASRQGVTGDFNGDGKPDVISFTQDSVYVLLDDGTGKLSLAHTYVLPGTIQTVGTASLRNNGTLDLVVITIDSSNNWTLNVMLGNGDGSFGAPASYPQAVPFSESEPAISLADFNGDHFPDLAVLSNGQMEVFLGKGNGTFGTGTSYFVGTAPGSLLTADFNNDGNVDVAVVSGAGLAILLGKGDGTFSLLPFSSDGNGFLCASGDFNADGNLDLITCSIGASILLGKGDGTFTVLPVFQIHAVSGDTILAGAADFNGDGKLDLLGVQDSGYAWMTLGNGDGTFVQTPLTIGLGNINLALVADFNLDHRPDLAIGDSTNIFDRQGTVSTGVATLLNVSAPVVPPGFHVTASALSPSTVPPGSSATSTITVSPMSGFGGDVTFTCSSITLNGSAATTMPPVCSFSPNPVKSASGTTTLRVSTTPATSARLELPFGHHSGWSYALFLPVFGIMIGAGLKFNGKKAHVFFLLTLMLSGLIFMASCGGSGSSVVKTGSGGTPAGTYTITVTGSATGTTAQTANLTLTVQ
jgi:hypothetical protein